MVNTFSKDSNYIKNYIAFFDLDQTITKSISGKALARGAYRKGLMTLYDLANAIFLSLVFRLKLKDPLKIIDDMVSWVEGISEKTMVDLCSEVFRKFLLPSVYDEARSEIEFHKGENAKVVILSSAITPVCQDMAKNLGFDDIICSDLEVKNGYLTGRPRGHICFGEEKAIRLKEYCEKNSSSPSDAWYYGDSISDLPTLNSVGNPICVNPDHKLKKTAIKRGWKTFNWKI
jgi:putative phosphoserine phosphatase/1-acylglycerol-3-phosphate O-acyltransferase